MSVIYQVFANGDTDYVAKLNNNSAVSKQAIDALQALQSGAGGAQVSIPILLAGLFGPSPVLIGGDSYALTHGGTLLHVAAGFAWKPSTQTLVQSLASVDLDFVGQPAATYYIEVDAGGNPMRVAASAEAFFSVVWDGAAFGAIVQLAKFFFNSSEETNTLGSTANGASYASLDARLEADETAIAGTTAAIAAKIPLTYLDTDGTLAGNSDLKIATQKAVKAYADAVKAYADTLVAGVGAAWGGITGTLADQADLAAALAAKAPAAQPMIFPIWFPGAATGRTVVPYVGVPGVTVVFAAGLAGWKAKITANPSATKVYSFQKNGVEFGTLSVSAAGVKTWASAAGASIAEDDIFSVVEPTDGTLANVNITAKGTR